MTYAHLGPHEDWGGEGTLLKENILPFVFKSYLTIIIEQRRTYFCEFCVDVRTTLMKYNVLRSISNGTNISLREERIPAKPNGIQCECRAELSDRSRRRLVAKLRRRAPVWDFSIFPSYSGNGQFKSSVFLSKGSICSDSPHITRINA